VALLLNSAHTFDHLFLRVVATTVAAIALDVSPGAVWALGPAGG